MKKNIFIWGFVIIIIDQLTKLLVSNNLKLNESIEVIRNFFYISYVHNEGAAWSIFHGNRWFLVIMSFIALYAVIKYFLLDINVTKAETVGYSLLLGGVVGNLIDRLVHGFVIDFFDFFILGYNFPVFNIADTCIVLGVIIVLWTLIKGARR